MIRPGAGLARGAPWAGIALILCTGLCFSGLDTTVRLVGRSMPVLVILWVRYAVQAGAMGLWLALARGRAGAAPWRPGHPRFQVARGVLLLGSSAFGFMALQHLPVAEFTAIVMLTPVLVTLLAAWLLRERVSPLRWALVAGAFIGSLIVVRPGSGLFGWAVLLPLGSSAMYAAFQLLTRKLAALEHPLTTHFYTGVVGCLCMSVVLAVAGTDMAALLRAASPGVLGQLLLAGACGTLGHLLLILALGRAPASVLMPFTYAQIVTAAVLGWLIFGDLPDAAGWLGMGVIAACGATSAWLNLRAPATQQVIAVAPEED